MSKRKVGIVGCGAIGQGLAQAITEDKQIPLTITALHDHKPEKALALSKCLSRKPALRTLTQLFRESQIVVEAAGVDAVKDLLDLAARYKRTLVILSSGGLLANEPALQRALKHGSTVHVPSGAITGIDSIKTAATNNSLKSVVLTTTKPPEALSGAPGVIKQKIKLERLKRATILFEGSAANAAKLFPKNINVGATLSLAGLGKHKTKVRIVADPNRTTNQHEIVAKGSFGTLRTCIQNKPSKLNKKTSAMAMQSAVALLKELATPLHIGT